MPYTKYLAWAIIAGLCLVLLVPFIVSTSMFFPFITGKNFMFRIVVEVVFALYVLLALREPKYRPRSSHLGWALCAFVAWVAIATFFSIDPVKSFWSNFERMDGYVNLLHLGALFLVAGAVLTAQNWWERFFQLSVALSAIQGLWAIAQILGLIAISSQSGVRADTTFGNATYLAVYMLFNIFITLYLLVRSRESRLWQSLYGLALVLQVATLYYTETRGAQLGLLVGLVIAALFIIWHADSQWKGMRKISLWGLAGIAALVLVFLGIRDTSFVKNSNSLSRLASISLTDKTTAARFTIWGMAYHGFLDRPVTGWGQENFSFVFNKQYQPSMWEQEQWFDRAHNSFVDWLVEAGLPAFALYVSLFGLAAWAIYRSSLMVPEQAAFIGLLAAYGFNNLVVFDNVTSFIYFFLMLAFFHSLSRRELPGWMFLSRPGSDQLLAVAAPLVVVVVALGGWALNAPGIARAQNLLQAIVPQTSSGAKDPKVALAQFETALGEGAWPGNPIGVQEATEQMMQYAMNIAPNTSVDPAVKQDIYRGTHAAGLSLLQSRPGDARLELFFGTFLASYGQYTEAIQHLTAALADSPKKQQIFFQLGSVYLQAGDTKDASTQFQDAYALDPSFPDAQLFFAIGLYYAGQQAAGDALLQKTYGTVLVNDNRLLAAYTSQKMYGRLIAVWQDTVAKSPNDAQSHVGLANAYFTSGNIQQAIVELQKAAALSPGLAPQIAQLITELKNGTLKPH